MQINIRGRNLGRSLISAFGLIVLACLMSTVGALPAFAALDYPDPKSEYQFNSRELPRQTRELILDEWGTPRDESFLRKTLLFAPRLTSGLFQHVFTGRLARRVYNVVDGTLTLFDQREDDRWEKASHRFAASVLNPLGTMNDVYGDATALIQTPFYSTSRSASRIQICSAPITLGTWTESHLIHYFNPALHVGVVVDGMYEAKDPGGGANIFEVAEEKEILVCTDVPMLMNQTESIAIERLGCVYRKLRKEVEYELFGYNCAGFTKDVLDLAGLAYPVSFNLGIGEHLGTRKLKRIILDEHGEPITGEALREEVQRVFASIIDECSDHIGFVRKLIFALERGDPIPWEVRNYFDRNAWRDSHYGTGARTRLSSRFLTPGAMLQVVTSAARGENPTNQEFVKNAFLSYRLRMEEPPRGWDLERFNHLSLQGLQWINEAAPEVFENYE